MWHLVDLTCTGVSQICALLMDSSAAQWQGLPVTAVLLTSYVADRSGMRGSKPRSR